MNEPRFYGLKPRHNVIYFYRSYAGATVMEKRFEQVGIDFVKMKVVDVSELRHVGDVKQIDVQNCRNKELLILHMKSNGWFQC
ncbi:MAG: hypothetical protein AABY22_08155 [Nanoarchaeota archaeon]